MSVTEKTPVLYFNEKSDDEENLKKKCNSKSIIGWLFVTILLVLLILLVIQIFFSPLDQEFRFWADEPTGVRAVSPRFKDVTPKKKVKSADPWNTDFLIDPFHLCATRNPPNSEEYANDPEVKLLMLVPSAVDHFEQRKAIRNTWGSVAKKPLGPMRLAFILGTTINSTVDRLVQEESSEYRDIVQADLAEGHNQLTAKSIMMLKWVAKRCPHAQYFLKADDDTFVNLVSVVQILSHEPYLSQDNFISGFVETTAQPQREPEEYFYISMEDYPSEEYPPYASGSTYVMTIPMAIQLFEASKEVKPLLPKDDVFLTGLCAQHVAAPLIHEPSFVVNDPPEPPCWETFSPLAAVPNVTPDILELVWNDMTRTDFNSLRMMESAINATVLLRMKKSL